MVASFPPEEDSADSPHVASDSAGNFVVVWQSYQTAYDVGDTSYTGIVGKRYDSSGSVVGSEFLVNAYTTGFQTNPKIASDSAGNFVVVWYQYGNPGFIGGRRFDSSGNAIGDDFQVSPPGSHRVGYAGVDEDPDGIEIASGPAGNFMVVWNEDLRDGDFNGIFARAYDSAGNPIGDDFRVNSYTTGDQTYPGVAADGSGDFIVVWSGSGPGTWQGIFARRYDSTGGTMGTEFQVNAEPLSASPYANVKVAADATGSFVVVWQVYPRIEGRSFDSDGIPTGGDFVVTPQGYSSYTPYTPDLAAQAAGDFVVVWQEKDYSYYGNSLEIFGQRIGEAGSFGCTPAPKTGCRPQTTGRGGSIVLKDKSPDTKDSVVWRWVRGSETKRGDFGDPLTDTDYVLCLYDASANPQPRLQALAPAGGTCSGIYPCWKELGPERLDYTDRDADPDGLRLVRLMAGPEGKARIQVRGKGANLDMPALPLVPPVTVQLQASNDECWKAEYEEFIKKNQADLFKANPDAPECSDLADPACNGTCPPGKQCTDVGSSCECMTPCGDATAPECDGVCPAGLECSDTGSGCECLPPCGNAAAPQCNGVCPAWSECKLVGSVCACALCGNSHLETGEQCDDGNTANGDCCSSSCERDPAGTACNDGEFCTVVDECNAVGTCTGSGSRCGDGNVDTACGEECDTAGESETCNADCTNAVCGDSKINPTAGEQCDDGNTADGDCCSSSCQLEPLGTACDGGEFCTAVYECDGAGTCIAGGPRCGDGNVDTVCGEECDTAGESESCNADCTNAVCGDLKINITAGEECDDGNQQDGDGCSSQCLCNPATTPGVCNLTGNWISTSLPDPPAVLTITEDTVGNSVYSGTWGDVEVSGESTRSNSCGTGTLTLTYVGMPPQTYSARSMVHDSCNAVTAIVEDPYFTPFTIDRVTLP